MVGPDEIFIVSSSRGAAISPATQRSMRGSPFRKIDLRFLLIALLSIGFHTALIIVINKMKLKKSEIVIEQISERFARLIIEKPIPKKNIKKAAQNTTGPSEQAKASKAEKVQENKPITQAQRTVAQKTVQTQVARVEKKIRTVGVLGMLTGVGVTAKGPSVVDVLGAMGDKKSKFGDLDDALEKMSGLQKTQNVDILDRKLVKSKDVSISHKEEIDDLIAAVGQAKTMDLVKKGQFIVQRPESIEGSASSNAKRDPEVINGVVASHKTSIRMSYEKFLKRNPDLAGKITVRFTISASGRVTMVKIIENTTGNPDLEQEIMRKIRMWQFESISEGDVTVSYPFVFMTAG